MPARPLASNVLFSDFPDTAVTARALHFIQKDPAAAQCLVRGRGHAECRGLRWLNAN